MNLIKRRCFRTSDKSKKTIKARDNTAYYRHKFRYQVTIAAEDNYAY